MIKPLCYEAFDKEDDFAYLQDDAKWIRRLSYRIASEDIKGKIIPILKVLLHHLENNPDQLDLIIEKVFSRGAEHTYLIEIKLTDLDFNQRKEIEACFVATIIRHLILQPSTDRDTTKAREEFRKRLTQEGDVSYADIMQEETGSDMELTCLFRFERAVLIAKSYISGNRNKGLFLLVGNLLEGSDDFTKYITGGHASKETRRRVMMIERLCSLQPRKRIKRLASNLKRTETLKETDEAVLVSATQLARGNLSVLADTATCAPQLKDFSAFGFRVVEAEEENIVFGQYKAIKNVTSASVMIKTYSKDYQTLFSREVELMKKLNQRDCIVQMVGFSEEGQGVERLIIYENGYDRRISELVGADPSIIVRAWIDVMEAVLFVHSHEIVIKNLKPETIYLAGPLHNLRIKLGDFAHAEKVTSSNTIWQKMSDLSCDDPMEVVGEKYQPLSKSFEAEKEDIEGSLNEILLQDSPFVAPELFLSYSQHRVLDYKSDVWSLGLLGLFLLKHIIPWKEVQFIQESIGKNDSVCEETMEGLLSQLSWEDNCVKEAVESCLKVSTKDRVNVLELRHLAKESLRKRKARRMKQEIVAKNSPFVQSLSSFTTSIRAMAAVIMYDKINAAVESSVGTVAANATPSNNFSSIAASRFPSSIAAPYHPKSTTEYAERTLLLNGRFAIIFTLQRGKDHHTHIVQHIRSERKQIIKQIRSKTVQNENELSILRHLKNQASIIELEEFMEDKHHKYVVLDGFEDGCLMNVLNEHETRMNEKCVQSIAKSLMSAVEFMHSKGFFHRGLNLSRILMKKVSEDEMRIKIWDFETAISREGGFGNFSNFQLPNSFSSSPPPYPAHTSSWMQYPEDEGEEGYYCLAPEILFNLVYPERKVSYNEKVDHWSVGMILYLLVEGRSCFAVRGARAILEDIEKWSSEVRKARLTGKSAEDATLELLPFLNKEVSGEAKSVIGGLLREEAKERIMFHDVKRLWGASTDNWEEYPDLRLYLKSSLIGAEVLPLAPSYIASGSGLKQHGFNQGGLSSMSDFMISTKPYLGGMGSMPMLTSAIPPMAFPVSMGLMTSSPMVVDTSSTGGRGLAITPPKAQPQPQSQVNPEEVVKQLLQDNVFTKKESYLKYFEYQKAFDADDLERAHELQKEYLEIDATFKAEYGDEASFRSAYEEKLNALTVALAEFKKEVTKDPLLFPRYMEYKARMTTLALKLKEHGLFELDSPRHTMLVQKTGSISLLY